jgi:hypothetical protein
MFVGELGPGRCSTSSAMRSFTSSGSVMFSSEKSRTSGFRVFIKQYESGITPNVLTFKDNFHVFDLLIHTL